MIVENLKLYNWHQKIASYYYPLQNLILTVGWSEFLTTEDSNLVGFWKIKKLKQ